MGGWGDLGTKTLPLHPVLEYSALPDPISDPVKPGD